jgi:hypothetical protein
MLIFFTPLTIFIATCAGYIFGFFWYSPMLFAKAWMKGEGLTAGALPKRSTKESIFISAYSFIAHCALTSVLALMLDVLHPTSFRVALSFSLLVTLGFIVTTKFIDMIYTSHGKHYDVVAQFKFLVSAGYYLSVVTLLTSVLFYIR